LRFWLSYFSQVYLHNQSSEVNETYTPESIMYHLLNDI
jgi:hypothetical protein